MQKSVNPLLGLICGNPVMRQETVEVLHFFVTSATSQRLHHLNSLLCSLHVTTSPPSYHQVLMEVHESFLRVAFSFGYRANGRISANHPLVPQSPNESVHQEYELTVHCDGKKLNKNTRRGGNGAQGGKSPRLFWNSYTLAISKYS